MYKRSLAVACAVAVALPSGRSSLSAQTSRGERSEQRRLERLSRLDTAHFERTATVQDSELDVTATISTQPGFRYRGGLTERVRSDNFLRAIVDKQTGLTVIQLYQTIMYTGQWRHFRSANYQSPDGLRSTPLIAIENAVPTCNGGLCVHDDQVAFDIPEQDLRRIVAAQAGGSEALWRFKFNATSGEDWEDSISVAEIAGLLRRLDQLRAGSRQGSVGA
jgi:hypothetical protein